MEGYRERLKANIARERTSRGESPLDLAVAIGVDKRTVERWESGERVPQTKKLKALADHWELKVGDLKPDPEAEERALRRQLDRMEAKLDAICQALEVGAGDAVTIPHHGATVVDISELPTDERAEHEVERPAPRTPARPPAAGTARGGGRRGKSGR